MNDQEIKQAIFALVVISAVFAVVLAAGALTQLQAKDSELLSWNSWVNYFSG